MTESAKNDSVPNGEARFEPRERVGALDGAVNRTWRASLWAAFLIASIPANPATFAISWESVTTAPVPCGITARANSGTQSNELSKWMCSSTNDGTTTVSEQSMTSWPLRYLPIPAIRPSTRRYRLVEFSGEYVGDRGIGKNSVGQYLSTSDSDLLSPTIEIRTHADESQQMDDS